MDVAVALAPTRRVPLALHRHHVRRLEAVVDFVDAHLDAALSLDRLAGVAALSPYHFHRLFHQWSGETLNEFVRRRRLEVAAGRLRHCPDEKITAVSLNCGFASPEGFARAVRERFDMTPSMWRESGRGEHPRRCEMRSVTVTHEPAMALLYVRGRGQFNEVAPRLWEQFASAIQHLGLEQQPWLFMGLDDPEIAGTSLCRMDACVPLPANGLVALPALSGMHHRWLPARWVATLDYDGPSSCIADGWDMLLNQWLPQSAYQLAIGPFYERYEPQLDPPGGSSARCTLGMPIEPRMF